MAVRLHGPVVSSTELGASSVGSSELASAAVVTAKLGPSAVTGAKLATTAIKSYGTAGNNGSGAITLTGAAVGDRVVGVAGVTTGATGNQAAAFEATITVADQIQQSSASDLSAKFFVVTLVAASA